ncbi:cache domain-containing protein [Methanosarcina sp. Mfa9]|uniref:cache domain-containing protein n=1 Tax=Methanosarcina sp. Mfa9 TaxID=3439063 RepID=UPI003F86127B
MRNSKLCIQLILVIFLILAISGCAQQEEQIQEEDEGEEGEEALAESESEQQQQSGLTAQKDSIALKVNEAVDLVEEEGAEAFPEFREEGGEWFRGDSYIFIWNTNGTRVVYPPDPSGEGEDVSGLTDFNGKPIGELFIETALSESGEGWVSYEWPKPGETEPSTKYSFIKRAEFGGETYLVGDGFYVEDYLFTRNIGDCEFINATGVSLCEFMHPGRTDTELGVDYSIAYVLMEPGEKNLPHRLSNPEVHYVLEGSGTIYINDVPLSLNEGKLVHVPANEIQYVENTGNSPLGLLVIDQPAWAEENEEIVE